MAQRTGEVKASLVHTDHQIDGAFLLTTGIGERGIRLAPNIILLPREAGFLPPDLVTAAQRVLGQALSIARAPAGSLPPGVEFIPRRMVVERGRQLAQAGRRVEFGEPLTRVIRDLAFDWLGNRDPDPGFEQLMRSTDAGAGFLAEVGAILNDDVALLGVLDAQQEMARSTAAV